MLNLINSDDVSDLMIQTSKIYSFCPGVTEALLSAVLTPDPHRKMKRIILLGEVPNPSNPPSGCYFHPGCRYTEDTCKKTTLELVEVENGHYSTCHFAKNLELKEVIY